MSEKALNPTKMEAYRHRFKQLWEHLRRNRAEMSVTLGNAGEKETAQLLAAEIDGGFCPRCNEPWRRVDFENLMASGFYYEPTCECYPKCPRCGGWQYEEMASGILQRHEWQCRACAFKLKTFEGSVRWGDRYQRYWNGLTRYQQYTEAIVGTEEEDQYARRSAKAQQRRDKRREARSA